MHGKTSIIHHSGKGVFKGVNDSFVATRYHSLIIERESLPTEFEITGWTNPNQEIMGIWHAHYSLEGVQFHPESVLTQHGYWLLKNLLNPISQRGHHLCVKSH